MRNTKIKEPLRIYLCDDQEEHIQQICNSFATVSKEYPLQITSFLSPAILLEQLKKQAKQNAVVPEIVLLDIKMSEIDGVSLGKEIKQAFPEICLVFITAYEEYAIQGYEANAFRYLLKPITKEHILKLLIDLNNEQNKRKKIIIKTRDGECFLHVQDIIHISAEDKYAVIYTENEHYVSDCSLKDYEERLTPYGFFRIHRKHLINMYHHKAIKGSDIVLSNGILLPISKRKITTYRSRLFSCLKEDLI
ncbi:MAG: LytTR family DNA-binding domain-containing protein [Lachnospiraceae bacterium]|nr:LytTR family DNA-binding domain-containing protein [Lachnospiraceae bacterium]